MYVQYLFYSFFFFFFLFGPSSAQFKTEIARRLAINGRIKQFSSCLSSLPHVSSPLKVNPIVNSFCQSQPEVKPPEILLSSGSSSDVYSIFKASSTPQRRRNKKSMSRAK
ncbi:hypothetical protein FN846DRAFT_51849 [Sphaerosporella brunnea]|uniref:Uncharacterized protein n=1 Tax=Sphaerosporella brunnea TaxID=1250544 RepID=A0A5J5EUN2_9PEZI|nr:hypothetical protein FN846DRAFT_51849 [Sphaerosporella brunnea]